MKHLLAIWRRELTACFLSPIAYVTMVVFLGATGFSFMVLVVRTSLTEGPTTSSIPLTTLLYVPILIWATVLITVVTMRMFAEEKHSGTIETLLTAPVSEGQVVLGKYFGALSFICVVYLPAVLTIYLLAWMSPGIKSVNLGGLVAGGLMLLMITAFCISIGLFVSLLTRNQIVAAICILCAIWFLISFGDIFANLRVVSQDAVEFFSVSAHMEDFSAGFVDTRPVLLYLSGTAFFLFVSTRVLESRKWW